jgi:hypothetical protein
VPAIPSAAPVEFEMIVFGPSDVKKYEWPKRSGLPVESTAGPSAPTAAAPAVPAVEPAEPTEPEPTTEPATESEPPTQKE